ncbi:T9SS type A sorting domain-containing protein [Chitinivibrio alkaliphilus]|uniref:Chitin deacetylase n=1 Tax=Chitinivibrio alkaliphilus ACht1 TaxID=1313304 RepID=U7D735_9BACT|nr:T9SS type A sorting domain-containing protein [Chitinivibrio alkaliphilus]ERP30892.1 chitin deacetylase [Chitinivibrio alkaliphilus ACht1]
MIQVLMWFIIFVTLTYGHGPVRTGPSPVDISVGTGAFTGVPYSTEPPGGLEPEEIPLFISLGFDDNRYADGVDWVVEELFAGRYNNEGAGNPATFDGTPMVASFYVIGNSDYPWSETPYDVEMPSDRPVTDSWIRAYEAGFGMGNHTWTHEHNLYDLSGDDLIREIGFCSRYMINIMGMPHAHIYGFRTPYLANSSGGESFAVSRDLGMLYDCTLNNGLQGNRPAEWTRADFPGGMDDGWGAWGNFPTEHFWQYPNATYSLSDGGTFSDMGFDSGPNGWPGGASAEEMFNQMRRAIEYHYETNRAPIDLGLHSDYYSEEAQNTPGTGASEFSTGLEDRRRALVMLLDWIEEELPHARVVEKIDAIRWMTNPVALTDLSRAEALTFSDDAPSGVLTNVNTLAHEGSSAEIISDTEVAVTVADEQNWKVEAYAGTHYPLGRSMEDVHSVRVRYSSDLPLRLILYRDDLAVGSHGLGLPATHGAERVVELPVVGDYFELPRPYDEIVPLDLSEVTDVALVAEVMDTTMSGNFTAEVEFFGAGDLGGQTSVIDRNGNRVESRISVSVLDNSRLSLSVPHDGSYDVRIYNYRGQQVSRQHRDLSAGTNTFSTEALSSGTYLMQISGESVEQTARFRVK